MLKKASLILIFVSLIVLTLSQVNTVEGKQIRPTAPKGRLEKSCDLLFKKIQASFGSTCTITPNGKEPYDRKADINNDGQINIMDFSTLSAHYENNMWCEQQFEDKTNPCVSTPTSASLTLNSQNKSNFTGYSRFFNSN